MSQTRDDAKPIGVGIIGASPGMTWASIAHLPALASLPRFAIVAVSTTKQASATETAKAYRVPHAFDRPEPLIAHPAVDLVVVSVKAPDHGPLVRAAIEAKKDVFCEWPLGASQAETRDLAARAKRAGIRSVIGLQRRMAPSIRHLRTLTRSGWLGKLRSVTVHASVPLLGATRPKSYAYTADVASGANALHTMAAHFLDTVFFAVGQPRDFTALVTRQFDTTTILETGETLPVTAPDQVLVSGTMRDGAVLSVHIEAGKRSGADMRFTFTGTEGDVTMGADFVLHGARGDGQALAPIAVPDEALWLPKGSLGDDAYQTAHLYDAYARGRANADDTGGPASSVEDILPTFEDAERLHDLLERFDASSRSGTRVTWDR